MMRKTLGVALGLIAAGSTLLPIPAQAQVSARHLAKEALQECDQGRAAKVREARLTHFQTGQALAEQAVALDERYADAHFSLFCNLGEQLRIDGESFKSAFGFRRMMNELNRTLELNPGHLDAISAKGTLLVKLPGLLGGDREKGEQLLQQVVKREPQAVNARLALARVRCERGRHQEAMTLASDALAIARRHKRAEFIPEARAVLQQLRANATTASNKPPL
jgi:tetratricopeptide (TPR) repeat protein